jgi:RHS repeat-associated protein
MRTTKVYDRLNRLLSIASTTNGASGLTLGDGYEYNAANQRTRVVLPDGSYWIYRYDTLGQVISGKRYWSDNTPVAGQQFEYGFDDIGNRKSAKSGGDATGANLRSSIYTADFQNRYSSRTVPATFDVLGTVLATNTVTVNSVTPYRKGEYFRQQVTAATQPAWTSITVASPTQTSVTGNVFTPGATETYTSDADGNLTQDGRWTYAWDGENRLLSMISATTVGPQQFIKFEYDWQGRRIRKQVWNSTTATNTTPALERLFVYDDWNLIGAFDSAKALKQSYTWGLDLSGSQQGAGGVGGLLWVSDRSTLNNQPSTHFAAYDGNGNLTGLINAANSTTSATYEYSPFGELIRQSGTMAKANPFRFSTKYQDDETDLLYYGYRYYNTSTGRWPSRDPIEERGGGICTGL